LTQQVNLMGRKRAPRDDQGCKAIVRDERNMMRGIGDAEIHERADGQAQQAAGFVNIA